MKFVYISILSLCIAQLGLTQVSNYPTPAKRGTTVIKNATIHVGRDGKVIEDGTVIIKDEKIIFVGPNGKSAISTTSATVVDAAGKHVYPSLILSSSQLGLIEIAAVRATLDGEEVGFFNTNVKAEISYNTDSRIINNIRSNGILLADIAPTGEGFAGQSSVMQFDAWNWEDAIYKSNVATHLYLPSLVDMGSIKSNGDQSATSKYQDNLKKVQDIRSFLQQAKSYCLSTNPTPQNLHFEALRPLFAKSQKLFVHCNWIKEMLVAVDLMNDLDIQMVIVGGYDSWLITDILRKYNVPVILESIHSLPVLEDDNIKQPFLTPSALKENGVLFALNQENTHDRGLNLPFLAGTASYYGLTQEEALQAVTYNVAKILGIDHYTGSIEENKDANLVISEGDLLDMKTSQVVDAYIQGRKINMDNVHKELRRRYESKYNLR